MTAKASEIAKRYTPEDLETAGRCILRENTLVPPEIIEFMTATAVEKLKKVKEG